MRRLVLLSVVCVFLEGCGTLGLFTRTHISVLSGFEEQPFVVPDSVASGEVFTVIVYTVEPCDWPGPPRVEIEGNVATITPYSSYLTPREEDCHFSYTTAFVHEATIQFTEKGQATIFLRVRLDEANRAPHLLRRTLRVY